MTFFHTVLSDEKKEKMLILRNGISERALSPLLIRFDKITIDTELTN